MKKLSKILSVGLSLAMCASMVAPALAATWDISNGSVYVGMENGQVVSWQSTAELGYKDKEAERQTGDIIISQMDSSTATNNTILVLGGVTGANITLSGVNIESEYGTALQVGNGTSETDVNIKLDGDNRLVSGSQAGITVTDKASVTIGSAGTDGSIDGRDYLYAQGAEGAAGIGGGSAKAGNITINGGEIEAVAGNYDPDFWKSKAGGAGIGSGGSGTVGSITINGGKVTATGGTGHTGTSTGETNLGGGAGIGSGGSGSAGSITINGGLINATGGNQNGGGAGIGAGSNGTTKDITITGGNVTATGGNGVQVGKDGTAIGNVGGGAGIGSGSSGNKGKASSTSNIEIKDGGIINATGGDGAAGIGSGSATWHSTYPDKYKDSSTGDITIGEGSSVTANGGWAGAGIGTGQGGSVTKIEIDGAIVNATGGDKAPKGIMLDGLSGKDIGAGAGIGTGHKGTVGEIKVSSGNVTANANETGAGIGTGQGGKVDKIEVSGGLVNANGGKAGAGIGSGYLGTANQIEISNGNVTANGGYTAAGIGSGQQSTVDQIKVSGGKVTAKAGDYAAGIGSGWKGTATQIEVSGGDVKACGGLYSAAIGAGYQGTFGAVSITGGDIVAQSGKWASAIGNDYYGTGGTIAIKGVNSLIALGDFYFAVDTRGDTAGVEQTILNGRFLENASGLSKVNEVEFVIVDAEGNEVKRFTLKPQSGTNMYESFAVNLPESGTYYVFCEGDYDNSIAGYESGGTQVAYVISEGDMLSADLMQFPSFDVSYSFISGTEGQELPESITAPSTESGKKMTLDQLNKLVSGTSTYDDVKVEGGTWHFDGWSMNQPVINETGVLTDAELVGTWIFTADQPTPTPDPVTNSTVEIEEVDVPLAGIFTRADAIGYLWEQSGSPEWELSDFEDVPEDHYWAVAIGWAQDMGIAVADEDGNFRPDDLVLRSVESLEISPEGELQEFLNRYAVYAGIKLDEGELFIELAGAWDDVIMGEEAQVIFDDFFAKLELALAQAA